jgi:hypothetical protein
MKKLLLPLALLMVAAPLAGCDQNKHHGAPVVKERALRGALRGAGAGMRNGHRGLRRACAADLQQYCAGTDRGRARRECLQNHVAQLSADCKSALESRGKGRRRRDTGDDTE